MSGLALLGGSTQPCPLTINCKVRVNNLLSVSAVSENSSSRDLMFIIEQGRRNPKRKILAYVGAVHFRDLSTVSDKESKNVPGALTLPYPPSLVLFYFSLLLRYVRLRQFDLDLLYPNVIVFSEQPTDHSHQVS